MIYDGDHILWGFPLKLFPTGGSYATAPFNLRLAGLGMPLSFAAVGAAAGSSAAPGGPPQDRDRPFLSYEAPVSTAPAPQPQPSPMVTHQMLPQTATPCPTCHLTPIPYNPSLPVFRPHMKVGRR